MHVTMYGQSLRPFPSANRTDTAVKVGRNRLPGAKPLGRRPSHQQYKALVRSDGRPKVGQSGTQRAILWAAILVKAPCSASLQFRPALVCSTGRKILMFVTHTGRVGRIVSLSACSILSCNAEVFAGEGGASKVRSVHVAGSGTDLLNSAIVHSKKQSPTGMIQKSTETVELKGDLAGRVLYHVTSTFDFTSNTLVNTGDQVFSGTIAGSEPVMIHDGRFRFDVNLKTGAEIGSVYLTERIAGPMVRCTLQVVGTGKDADANPTFNYTGRCDFPDK